ncbi:MAG: M14 family zinc carboxypeptidase [Bacteroidota bacterium]
MRFITFILALLLSTGSLSAQKKETYSRAKIYLDPTGHTINDLSALGLAVDHGDHKKNTYFTSDFSSAEIARARKAGFKVDIVIADVSKHYRDQNKKKAHEKTTALSCDNPAYDVPSHFHLGSYAGFFTYAEMVQIVDSMRLLYPGLISAKQPIGTYLTIEGRPIYWIRISNNPTVDQPGKPQALFTAVHHAREPGSMAAVIYTLWYMLEHYATDARIKTIIDNTELYFVPCLNPDGYLYNEFSDPGGGGLWRKNRRNNGGGEYGVDLNRNYGHMWAYDDVGSSPAPFSETYRGTAAFSEPETQAIKWFTENHNFKFTMNYHSYHNDILYPWSYIPSFQTVDSNVFFNYGEFLTEYNDYRFGTCDQVLGYITNGDSNDWMYGETTAHSKIFAFTPEVGSSDNGFWPPVSQIIPDCQNSLIPNINVASLLLPFASIHHTDKKILTAASGYVHYSVQRLGLPDTGTFTASLIPLDSWLTTTSAPRVYTGLALVQEVADSFNYSLSSTTPNGQLVRYILRLYNGHYNIDDTVSFYYGKKHAETEPSTNSLAAWINDGWGVSTGVYHTAPAAIQSSLSGSSNYLNNADITIATATPIDLTYATRAYLHFYARWALETDFDYVYVNASVQGSGTWARLCGKYTRPARFTADPSYDGQMPDWVMEEMDLSDYLGQKINIQFELFSDPGGNYKGYYFDDVSIVTVQDTPTTVRPLSIMPVISVFPNPASTVLNIAISGQVSAEPLQAVLYNQLGRQVRSFAVTHSAAINIQELSAGIYTLKLWQGSQPLPVQKITISR